jgi:hypothetical protein
MDQSKDSSESNGRPSQEIMPPTLGELLADHLAHCSSCVPDQRPVGLGGESLLCGVYWDLVQEWSDREGNLNNIVAHDEYGNDAPRKLDPDSSNPAFMRYT